MRRLSNVIPLIVVGLLVHAIPTLAEPPVKPGEAPSRYELRKEHDPNGIGKFYIGREIAQVMGHLAAGWLDRSEREKEEAPAKLMELLKLKPGEVVADIGAGTGYFSFRVSEKVGPTGKVYAVDIQQEMLDIMAKRMQDHNVKNIELIKGTESDPKLPANAVDLIMMVDVYHEFSFPYEMTVKMVQALKPGGRLVFVEYRLEDPEVPIKLVHKMSEKQVKKEMEPHALRWLKTYDALPRQHVIVFAKKGEPMVAIAKFPEVAKLPIKAELPDPLMMLNGDRITTPEQWRAKRRPELKALFEHYMYGQAPAAPDKIQSTIEREDRQYFGGKATKKEVTISFGPDGTPPIHLLLVIPNARKKPAPVFVGLNFCGNHTFVKDPAVALPAVWMPNSCPGCKDNKATDAGRGTQIDIWSIEDTIDRGYATATFYCGDIAPDHPGFKDGIIPRYWKKNQTEPGPHEWGTIAAWAWGISRAVDYLRTDKDIDGDRIAAVGHSRMGKATLLAGAFDERIALVIPHQAGCGGTAPSRGKVGESVAKINTSFPHWFNTTFKEFNEKPECLPFDQHCLMALVAPRPLLLTNAVEDQWSNPQGQFEMLQAAEPVYRLLKAGGLEAKSMPEPGKLIDSKLGYYIRPGKHSMGKEDWKVFLDYADRYLGKTSGQ